MKAAAWFYSQSFHDLERVTPDVPTPPGPGSAHARGRRVVRLPVGSAPRVPA